MDKQQFSWLIVRAFGVYLLLQAFVLAVRILGNVYMYSSLASSLGTNNDYAYALVRSYRSSMAAGLIPFVVFSATGIYFLRGGRFLMRWLQYVPNAPTELGASDVKPNLTQHEAHNMTVKERLAAAGLFHEFADAVERRDVPELERILHQTHLEPDGVQAVIEEMLGTRGDAQQIGYERRSQAQRSPGPPK
jgi:hypothetical protein